jgi:hypothetical protein
MVMLKELNQVSGSSVQDKQRADVLVSSIKQVVCNYFQINISDLKKESRKRELVYPKHLTIFLIGEFLGLPIVETGRYFNLHHASVVHANKKVQNYLDVDKHTKVDIDNLRKAIKAKIMDNFEDSVYYIDMNEFNSLQVSKKKFIIMVGFSDEEVSNIDVYDRASKTRWNNKESIARKHSNMSMYVMEEKKEQKPKKITNENT